MEENLTKEDRFAKLLEEYPELIYQLKTPEQKKYNHKKTKKSDSFYEKVGYNTETEAREALSSCWRERKKGNGKRKECRVYKEDDGGWYLTSKSKGKRRNKINYSRKHATLILSNNKKKKK